MRIPHAESCGATREETVLHRQPMGGRSADFTYSDWLGRAGVLWLLRGALPVATSGYPALRLFTLKHRNGDTLLSVSVGPAAAAECACSCRASAA
jgi:hypothetical protein